MSKESTLNVKDELSIFGIDSTRFSKKYSKNGELNQTLWKKLYSYCKKCDPDENSKDWNATLGKDPVITVNTRDLVKNCGNVFFTFFHDPEIQEKQKKKIGDFIRDRFGWNTEWAELGKYFLQHLKKRKHLWSGEAMILQSFKQNLDDRDTLPIQALKNWEYVFDITGDAIIKSASILNIFLAFSEKVFGGKIGSTVSHLAVMDTWRDHLVWALRGKLGEKKYFDLALQPCILTSLDNAQFEVKRVRLLWQVGRLIASNGPESAIQLESAYFGQTIGEALRFCLDPEATDYQPQTEHYQLAAEILCHLCVPPIDIPFRSENIKKLKIPLTPVQFLKIVPMITERIIKFMCISEANSAAIPADRVQHTLTCFLSALGKCSNDVIPSLSTLAEFVDQQTTSKQSTTIIREILARIPPRLIQKRFQTDSTESGFGSVAMTLLKVTLKTNGHNSEEAKKIIQIVLTSDEHLAALDQITITLAQEVDRPGHSAVQILKLWTQTAQLFTQRISRGLEVSNEPNNTDLISVKNFFVVPLSLDHPNTKIKTPATLQQYKLEFKNCFVAVCSSASVLSDFSKDKFVTSITKQLLEVGMEKIGETLSLEILDSLILTEAKNGFENTINKKYESEKYKTVCSVISKATECYNFRKFNADPIEACLSIISKILSHLEDELFDDISRLLPLFARPVLLNRKNPTWQRSLDLIIGILEQIERASRCPRKMYDSLENFFIVLLSGDSSKRMKILAAQAWEAKFKDENIILGDEFWKSIEPYYKEGKWVYPKGRTPLSEVNSREFSKNSGNTPKRTTSQRGTPQRGTPQRLNRQQAAMAGISSGTPTRKKGKGPIASTFHNQNDDSEFISIESPISFNKKKLTDKQREKMKEKRAEEGFIPALYDGKSQQSNYLENSKSNTDKDPNETEKSMKSQGIDLIDPDESAVDFSQFKDGCLSSTLVQSRQNVTLGVSVGNTTADESTLDETKFEQSALNETANNDKTHVVTCNNTVSNDVTLGVSVGNTTADESTLDETKFDKSALDETENIEPTIELPGNESNLNDPSESHQPSVTLDMTNGIATGGESMIEDITLNDVTAEDVSGVNNVTNNSNISADNTEVVDTSNLENQLPKPIIPLPKDDLAVPPKLSSTTVLEISSDDDQPEAMSDSEIVCMGELQSSELSGEDDLTGNETEEFDTADETTEIPAITIKETPCKDAISEPHVTQKLPTPKFDRALEANNESELADINTSLPAVSEEDEDLDMNEESIHEPFKNSPFTGEIKGSNPKQSPSILKRRRSSTDPNDSKRPRRSVSFCDQFKDQSKRLSARGNIGGLSPSARRLSRSGRMLQMAQKEGVKVSLLNTQEEPNPEIGSEFGKSLHKYISELDKLINSAEPKELTSQERQHLISAAKKSLVLLEQLN